MSDWQVGDLAVCADARPRRDFGHPVDFYNVSLLKSGATYSVSAIVNGSLRLRDVPMNYWGGKVDGYDPARFRKIRPDERKACEPEFIQLLNRSKRRVEA